MQANYQISHLGSTDADPQNPTTKPSPVRRAQRSTLKKIASSESPFNYAESNSHP